MLSHTKKPFWPMIHALRLAHIARDKGEIPVGAVLVHDNKIISWGYNRIEYWKNPLAHAEIICIVQGQKKQKSKYLSDCALYVTLQPCALCREALMIARIGQVYCGAYDTSLPLHWPIHWVTGIHEQACQALLHDFFKPKRPAVHHA